MTNTFKYPRTSHLPFSKGIETNDHVIKSMSAFKGQEIVVSLKVDGANVSLFQNQILARSLHSNHSALGWLTEFHASIKDRIPPGFRIAGESVYARHAVGYRDLPSYYLGFGLFDRDSTLVSWDDTLGFFNSVGVSPVPVLFRGKYDIEFLKVLAERFCSSRHEGFVVRLAGPIKYNDFLLGVAKFVRPNHHQVDIQHGWEQNGPLLKK